MVFICRACGQIFCSDCTKQKIRLPQFGYMNPERVCENCYQHNKMRQVDEEVGLSFLFLIKTGVTLLNFRLTCEGNYLFPVVAVVWWNL